MVKRFGQSSSGTGEVEPYKSCASLSVVGSVIEGDPGFPDKIFERVSGDACIPAIEPGKIRCLHLLHPKTGKFFSYVLHQKISVALQVEEHLIEPLLPIPVGCQSSHQAHNIHVRDESLAA